MRLCTIDSCWEWNTASKKNRMTSVADDDMIYGFTYEYSAPIHGVFKIIRIDLLELEVQQPQEAHEGVIRYSPHLYGHQVGEVECQSTRPCE